MSNISNRHNVNLFVAGKSEPLATQRLAKVGYKKTKDCPNPLPSICVSVPMVSPASFDGVDMKQWLPHLVSLVHGAQDGIIRSLYESSGGTLSAVTDDDIGLSQCLNYLAAKESGDRLSAESIGAWFDANVNDNLTVVIADKLGFTDLTEENETVIAKHVAWYKGICVLMAGKGMTKESLSAKQKKAIQVSMKLDTAGGVIGEKIGAKLAEMEKKVDMAELLELDI